MRIAAAVVAAAMSVAGCGSLSAGKASGCSPTFASGREAVFVADAQANEVDAFALDTCGSLTRVGSVTAAGSPADLAASPDGRHLYVAGQKGVVAQFAVGPDGSLQPLHPATVPAGSGARSIAVAPSGRFVYVANSNANTVSVYSVDPSSGTLRPLPGPAFAVGASSSPWSLVMPPSGRFLYVVERGANVLAWFPVDPSTGQLTRKGSGSTSAYGIYPRSLAFSPSGRYAYLVNESDTIAEFSVDPTLGTLRPLHDSPLTLAGEFPWEVTLVHSGQFAYVVNNVGFVMEYEVNLSSGTMASEGFTATTGEILPLPGSPATAGTSPCAMTVDPSGRFAFVAEEYANSLMRFKLQPSGLLAPLHGGSVSTGADPQAVLAVTLPAAGRA